MRASAVAGLIFANVNDSCLKKLTEKRSMASVPFGARYRLIDFPLSNLVNAGVTSIGVITKENYRSLMDHLGSGVYWDLDRKKGGIYLLPPFVSRGVKRYTGTVDAMNGAMDYISRCNADYMVICNTDSVANIDISAAVKFHTGRNADITLVYHHGTPPATEDIIMPNVSEDGRINKIDFGAKGDTEADYFIGVMIISRGLLMSLVKNAYEEGCTDFAREVVTANLDNLRVFGFCHKEYAAVLNSTEGYCKASRDLLRNDVRKQLFNKERPIYTKTRDDMPTRYGTKSNTKNCFIADGCVINGTVKNSILFRGVTIEKGAVVENCILMQETSVAAGAQLNNVMSDKNATVGENMILKGTDKNCFFVKKNQIL